MKIFILIVLSYTGNLYATNSNQFQKYYKLFNEARMSPSKYNLHSLINCKEIALNSNKKTIYDGPLMKKLSKNGRVTGYVFDFRGIRYHEKRNEITAENGPFRFVKVSNQGKTNIVTWKLNTKENKNNKAYYRLYKNEPNFIDKKADAVGECEIKNFDLSFRYL